MLACINISPKTKQRQKQRQKPDKLTKQWSSFCPQYLSNMRNSSFHYHRLLRQWVRKWTKSGKRERKQNSVSNQIKFSTIDLYPQRTQLTQFIAVPRGWEKLHGHWIKQVIRHPWIITNTDVQSNFTSTELTKKKKKIISHILSINCSHTGSKANPLWRNAHSFFGLKNSHK